MFIGSAGSHSRQLRLVTHIFAHPLYSSDTLAHDIAVLRVELPFHVTHTFRAMPRSLMRPFAGTMCRLAGWGVTNEDDVIYAQSILLPYFGNLNFRKTQAFN